MTHRGGFNSDGANSKLLPIALGAIAATVTLATMFTIGFMGYMIGKEKSNNAYAINDDKNESKDTKDPSHSSTKIPEVKRLRHRIPSSHSSQDVKISDKQKIVDVRITAIRPLLPPACLIEEIPLTHDMVKTINRGRQSVANILRRMDDRVVVVVGPCSIHDVEAAMDYANRLVKIKDELDEDLLIIMRVYFEKPRTTVGWKGLINDPDLNGTFNINKGLRVARELLAQINELGLPAGCEFLDTMSPQFFCDLVSWGAIGARTTECQLHRELTSGLSMPIGFKNGTGGSLQLCVDAVVAARHPHCFLSVSTQGLASIVNTSGNDCCHTILRGGKSGPNYEKEYIDEVSNLMLKAGLPHDNVMVDCSHGNSQKNFRNQPKVAASLAEQLRSGDNRIIGVMLESNIQEGAQSLIPGQKLEYGKSVTDGCMNWETTVEVLKDLAAAVRGRREKNKNSKN